jgi:hypothetical protein
VVNKGTKADTELASWQYMLREIVDSERLTALAEDLGMHKTTLERWMQGTTPRNFQRALQDLVRSKHFPEAYRSRFIAEVQKSYPHFQTSVDPFLEALPAKEIPSVLYSHVLRAVTFVSEPWVFWTVTHTVCQQLYGHLDADASAAVGAMLFLCTPPTSISGNIHSLYAPVRQISERFSPLPLLFPLLLGTESLLTDMTPYHSPRILSQEMLQACSTPFPQEIQQIALVPLQRRGKMAGVFLVTSHKKDFFQSVRQKVVYEYAILLSFAFREQDFYAKEHLKLAVFPHLPAQQLQEAQLPFRMRVERIREQFQEEEAPDQELLELLALQQLEQALIENRRHLTQRQSI